MVAPSQGAGAGVVNLPCTTSVKFGKIAKSQLLPAGVTFAAGAVENEAFVSHFSRRTPLKGFRSAF